MNGESGPRPEAATPPNTTTAMVPGRVRLSGDLFHPVVPPGAVNITRPGRWGNPHRIDKPCKVYSCDRRTHTRDEALGLFADYLWTWPKLVERARVELAGRDLACWCPLDQPCHGDMLLAVVAGDAR